MNRIIIIGPASTISARLAEVRRLGVIPAVRVIDRRPAPTHGAVTGEALPCGVPQPRPSAHPAIPAASVAAADQPRTCHVTAREKPQHVQRLQRTLRALDTVPGTLADDIGTCLAILALASLAAAMLWL